MYEIRRDFRIIQSDAMVPTPQAVAGATTWNPADKSANAVLSNGNLTLGLSSSGWWGARSIAQVASSQLVYYEIVRDAGTNFIDAGFGNSSAVFTSNIGNDGNSFGVFSGANTYRDISSADNGAVSLPSTAAVGDNIGLAFNSSTSRIWFRLNGGLWNNSAPANPATGTGGLVVAVTGPYFAFGGVFDTGDQSTVKFSSASWTYTAPSGFTQLQ